MPFEEFTRPRYQRSSSPQARLTKQGTLRVNQPCMELLPAGTTHVVLMYNRDSGEIALRPADEETPHAYRLRKSGAQRAVSAVSFLRYFDLPMPERSQSYSCRWDDQVGALILSSEGSAG
jgi:hypothetical protein